MSKLGELDCAAGLLFRPVVFLSIAAAAVPEAQATHSSSSIMEGAIDPSNPPGKNAAPAARRGKTCKFNRYSTSRDP